MKKLLNCWNFLMIYSKLHIMIHAPSWCNFFKVGGRCCYISVRAMQYMLDMNANTKIPDDLVHELPFKWFRTWFQCLERLWLNFKICGILNQLLVVFKRPFWYGANIVKEKPLKVPAEPAENYRSVNRIIEINKGVNHTFYRSSEFPAQIPQILRKFLRICQLFKVLPQRPQDQRPNSNTYFR